jgi:hypothetical protein
LRFCSWVATVGQGGVRSCCSLARWCARDRVCTRRRSKVARGGGEGG